MTALASRSDGVAFLAASATMAVLVEGLKVLAKAGVYPTTFTRKLLHMAAGPVFILTWPWFGKQPSSAVWAAAVPACMTAKFALVGAGLIQQDADVKLMSRTGDRRELLRGPLLYGAVFCAATVLGFRSATAGGALMALCAGDGMADVIGRRFGRRHKLPWSPQKSWAGSAAFTASAFAGSMGAVSLFHHWGWSSSAAADLALPLLAASVAAAAAESLPVPEIDNVVAPLCFALAMRALAPP